MGMLLLACIAHGQQQLTIHVPVRLVNAPTLVFSSRGQLVDGLDRSDFKLYDNGRLQNIFVESSADNQQLFSIAVLVQSNNQVRQYLPFIAKVGSVIDNLVLGEQGRAALLTYSDDIDIVKQFDSGDVATVLRRLSPRGDNARMVDAAMHAIELLSGEPATRTRVLLLIGQPYDSGSNLALQALQKKTEEENVAVYALSLPIFGKSFVSDSFTLSGLGSQAYKGGFIASVDLTKTIPALRRSGAEAKRTDPFSILTAATGGTLLHFRKQTQLEAALTVIGKELRTTYTLSYTPNSIELGYHVIRVQVDVPGAAVYSRPGCERR
jgi:VWFA-related protein